MSGRRSRRNRRTWSMRSRTELMFQVVTVSCTRRLSDGESAGLRQIFGGWKRSRRRPATLSGRGLLVAGQDPVVADREELRVVAPAPVDAVEHHGGLEALRIEDPPLRQGFDLRVEEQG